jgi:uncharacterized membrane protein YhhN
LSKAYHDDKLKESQKMTAILSTISLLTSLIYGLSFTFRPTSWTKTVLKAVPVLSLGLLSIVGDMHPALTAALLFGALGDVALSREGDRNFLIGLAAFLIGHLSYIALFTTSGAVGFNVSVGVWPVAPITLIILIGAWLYQRLYHQFGSLKVPVFVYVLVSILLGAVALFQPLSSPYIWAIIGALLFIFSDILLAFDLFGDIQPRRSRRVTAGLLWFCYWLGQCLILVGYSGWL